MATHASRDLGFGHELRGASLAFPASLLVLAVIIAPIVMLLRDSFNRFESSIMVTAFTFENYVRFFTDPYYQNVLFSTLYIAAVCTVLSLVLGFPVAYFLAKSRSRYKSVYIILLVFPLVVGSVVRSAGWMMILGDTGVINYGLRHLGLAAQPVHIMYTPLAVIIGTTSVVMPYLILILQSVLEGIDFSVEEAAQNLGANFLVTLRRVVIPLAAPGIATSSVLVFILCMNAFATPVLLGGTGIMMMAPALYQQMTRASNWPFGAALALILVLTTLIVALLMNWLIHRRYVRTMS